MDKVRTIELTWLLATLAGLLFVSGVGMLAWSSRSRETPFERAHSGNKAGVRQPGATDIRVSNGSAARADAALLSDRPGHKKINFIAAHWRGEYSLWISYWIFGVIANIALALFIYAVNSAVYSISLYNPYSVIATVTLVWVSVGLITTWQFVGVWRSSSRYIVRKNREGKKGAWGTIAKFALVFGMVRLVVEFGSSGVPQIQEAWRIAFLNDPSIPDYALRVMRNGTEIEVSGGIKFGLHDDFLRLLDAAPLARVIHLNSSGGRVGEALKLHRTIMERRLVTYVSHECDSACTLAFVGGHARWVSGRARVGFHASHFPGMRKRDMLQIDREQKDVLIARGISRSFVEKALSTPSDKIWYPPTEVLLRAGVINGVADSDRFAASGLGMDVSPTRIADGLKHAIPALRALEERSPNEFNDIVIAYYENYLSGETERNLNKIVRARLLPIIQFHRPRADDETVVGFGKLLIEQYKILAKRDYRLCFEYASGVGGSRDYSNYFPDSVLQRERVLVEQAIRTSANRHEATDEKLARYWAVAIKRANRRIGARTLQLLDRKRVVPENHADYCKAATELMRSVLALGDAKASLLLRQMFRSGRN